MLKSFNTLLMYKSSLCQHREQIARIFFPAQCTCMNFFWDDGLVQELFFKITHPPPLKLNGWPLNNYCIDYFVC